MRRDLERRQAAMRERQKSIRNMGVPPITESRRPSTTHACGVRDVTFCPFCRERINTTGEVEVSGFPKTDHRCARLAVSFCPFCGDNLEIGSKKTVISCLQKPQHVVLRPRETGKERPTKIKPFRWNKFFGRSRH